MKNIVFISTIIATNILSFISSLILEPSFTLKILNVCILIICQWTVYMSDEKKQNYVFPIKSIAKINFLFLILTSILALPKFINNSIPFNGYNFNDFFTLPLAFYLLLCFIKEKEEEYNYLENETKLSSWLPFICSILLQLAFYYIQYFDSITKGFTPQHTYAQNCHILHLTILLYFFIAVCAYFLIFFKFIEIKNKESKINNPIYSFKDTLIFVLLYIDRKSVV